MAGAGELKFSGGTFNCKSGDESPQSKKGKPKMAT
jgi:hypothetical protein